MFHHRVRVFKKPASTTTDEPAYWRGIFTGLRYQCVELARRYLLQTRGLLFDRVSNAHEILRLTHLTAPFRPESPPVPWPTYPNRAFTPAACPIGSLLVWSPEGAYAPFGHVAVVTHVTPSWVGILEQNEDTTRRRLPVVGGAIQCTRPDTRIVGWKPVPPAHRLRRGAGTRRQNRKLAE